VIGPNLSCSSRLPLKIFLLCTEGSDAINSWKDLGSLTAGQTDCSVTWASSPRGSITFSSADEFSTSSRTHLSQFRLPVMNTAIDAGVFRVLCEKVLTHEVLAAEIGVDARALQMWLAALSAEGFVEKRLG
jgi:hypothetical protein